MNIRKTIQKRIRRRDDRANVAADVNAVISANFEERSTSSHHNVSSHQRIVQRDGRTVVSEERTEASGGQPASDETR